jgi:hypothetical protein
MKRIGLAGLVILVACQVSRPGPASRPLMDPDLATKLCTNPSAVSVFGAECLMRDQSPPARLLPRLLPPLGIVK